MVAAQMKLQKNRTKYNEQIVKLNGFTPSDKIPVNLLLDKGNKSAK